MWNNLFFIAFSLFLLMDAIGNLPLYIALLQGIAPSKQKKIILREMIFAIIIIFAFAFLGDYLLKFLHITSETMQIAGGIILFIISLQMIFQKEEKVSDLIQITEPFLVPLAVPLIAGPAVLTTIILYSHQNIPISHILLGASIAWILSLIILLLAPFIAKRLGERGILAIQKLMGLILVLLSVQMFLDGLKIFLAPVK
jgi:multiple antibiotic resistance protein